MYALLLFIKKHGIALSMYLLYLVCWISQAPTSKPIFSASLSVTEMSKGLTCATQRTSTSQAHFSASLSVVELSKDLTCAIRRTSTSQTYPLSNPH